MRSEQVQTWPESRVCAMRMSAVDRLAENGVLPRLWRAPSRFNSSETRFVRWSEVRRA